jgi:hypothetical protein
MFKNARTCSDNLELGGFLSKKLKNMHFYDFFLKTASFLQFLSKYSHFSVFCYADYIF